MDYEQKLPLGGAGSSRESLILIQTFRVLAEVVFFHSKKTTTTTKNKNKTKKKTRKHRIDWSSRISEAWGTGKKGTFTGPWSPNTHTCPA